MTTETQKQQSAHGLEEKISARLREELSPRQDFHTTKAKYRLGHLKVKKPLRTHPRQVEEVVIGIEDKPHKRGTAYRPRGKYDVIGYTGHRGSVAVYSIDDLAHKVVKVITEAEKEIEEHEEVNNMTDKDITKITAELDLLNDKMISLSDAFVGLKAKAKELSEINATNAKLIKILNKRRPTI